MSRSLRSFGVFAVCVLMVLSTGCGKKEDQATPPSATSSSSQSGTAPSAPAASSSPVASSPPAPSVPAPTNAADYSAMAAQNAETLKAMNQGKDIEPITPETLKGFLPATLAAMERSDSEAQQVNMMGVNVTSGNAEYQTSDGEGGLELMITDLGNVSGAMRMGMAGWTMGQVNTQTDTGYEKTLTYQGHKAFEEYDRQEKYGTVRVFVADRFIVEVAGSNVTMETIKQALGQVDLKKLAAAVK